MCHLLFVSVRIIHAPRGLLSVARLHDPIPSNLTLYGPVQPLRESRPSPQLRFSLGQGHSLVLYVSYTRDLCHYR